MLKMVILFGTIVVTVSVSNVAPGQIRRYQPSRPTISPYFELLRAPNTGSSGISAYEGFFRRDERFNRELATTRRQLSSFESQLSFQSRSESARPNKAGTFMFYNHSPDYWRKTSWYRRGERNLDSTRSSERDNLPAGHSNISHYFPIENHDRRRP